MLRIFSTIASVPTFFGVVAAICLLGGVEDGVAHVLEKRNGDSLGTNPPTDAPTDEYGLIPDKHPDAEAGTDEAKLDWDELRNVECLHPDDEHHLTAGYYLHPWCKEYSSIYTFGSAIQGVGAGAAWKKVGLCQLNAFRVYLELKKELRGGVAAIIEVQRNKAAAGGTSLFGYHRGDMFQFNAGSKKLDFGLGGLDECRLFSSHPDQGPDTEELFGFHATAVWYDAHTTQVYVFDPDCEKERWGDKLETWAFATLGTDDDDDILSEMFARISVPICLPRDVRFDYGMFGDGAYKADDAADSISEALAQGMKLTQKSREMEKRDVKRPMLKFPPFEEHDGGCLQPFSRFLGGGWPSEWKQWGQVVLNDKGIAMRQHLKAYYERVYPPKTVGGGGEAVAGGSLRGGTPP